QLDSALAFYDKVVDVWFKFLSSVRQGLQSTADVGPAQLTEGADMLSRVRAIRAGLLGDDHMATGEASCTLGLLRALRGERRAARIELACAQAVYLRHLGPEHSLTRDIQGVLAQLEEA
ncbi:unnamed protein product, partial [Phaeothamnion confervicola]